MSKHDKTRKANVRCVNIVADILSRDLTLTDKAKDLGLSVSTVRQLFCRGIRCLRKVHKNYAYSHFMVREARLHRVELLLWCDKYLDGVL